MSLKGIDVSHYNQPIDWNKVKGQIDFAILKLGNIGDNQKFWLDDTFENNYSECKRLNIPIGVYVYCYCNSQENAKIAGEEVRNYLNDKPLELPIYIDMEDNEIKSEGKTKLTEIVIAFNTEIEKASKWAGVYANLDWFNNYLNKDVIKEKYTTWIAHIDYTNNQDKYKGQYDMFQYSWKGHIKGISGNNDEVDMNIMYRDLIYEINKEKKEEKKEEFEMPKTYRNGSTPETVFCDSSCSQKIGALNTYETCECLGIVNGVYIVKYRLDGTDDYKVGFVKYSGGID